MRQCYVGMSTTAIATSFVLPQSACWKIDIQVFVMYPGPERTRYLPRVLQITVLIHATERHFAFL